MERKKSFILYTDLADSIRPLSDEQTGQLFRAILEFADSGTRMDGLDSATQMAFSFVSSQITRESEKWERIKERRAAAGKAGGRARAENFKQNQANQANASDAKQIKQNQANQAVNVPVPVPVNVPVPVPVINKDITGVRGADKPPKSKFQKPTVQQIADYCQSRGNGIDAQSFFDCYEARGWMIGKTHMKDWKAAVRTWEHNDSGKPKAKQDSIDDQFSRVFGYGGGK